jgi:copper chaperone
MCTCSHQADPRRAAQVPSDAIELKVEDMSCGHCASTITRAIEAAMPGASVDVDLASKIVSVHGADDHAWLQRIIAEAGYRTAPA